jgi:hypothetical protein
MEIDDAVLPEDKSGHQCCLKIEQLWPGACRRMLDAIESGRVDGSDYCHPRYLKEPWQGTCLLAWALSHLDYLPCITEVREAIEADPYRYCEIENLAWKAFAAKSGGCNQTNHDGLGQAHRIISQIVGQRNDFIRVS